MVRQGKNEVSEEAAERKKDDPARPVGAARRHHSIHEQEKPKSRISQRSRKRSCISDALQCSIEKEPALQMIDHAPKPHQHRKPPNHVANIAPWRLQAQYPAENNHYRQYDRRS